MAYIVIPNRFARTNDSLNFVVKSSNTWIPSSPNAHLLTTENKAAVKCAEPKISSPNNVNRIHRQF
jgi:hypothetical protein